MGCDIHLYVERLLNGKWVPVNPLREDDSTWARYMPDNVLERLCESLQDERQVPKKVIPWSFGRDYPSFAILANVRNYGYTVACLEPKGLPDDLSEALGNEICDEDKDLVSWFHSPSHLRLKEFPIEETRRLRELRLALTRVAEKYNLTAENIRIVFCFDN